MATSITQRLVSIAKAAIGIRAIDSSSPAPSPFGLLQGMMPGDSGNPPYRGDANILQAYSTMPWLRAVSQRVSTAVASSATEWRLYAPASGNVTEARVIQRASPLRRSRLIRKANGNGELQEVDNHILLDALNRANPYMTGQALFQTTQVHLDLIGEAFWIMQRNGVGAPTEFWPIPPNWVMGTPTPSNQNYEVSFRGWQGKIPSSEVLWMADLDPSNPYGRGSGIGRAMSDELEVDEYASKFQRQVFFNRARPDMIVWPKQQGAHDVGLQQDQVRRLEERWLDGHQGFWRSFKPFFVGREIGVHEVSQSMRELQMIELRKQQRDTIVQIFGIPPELLGILQNSNRATIESADYLFSRWVLTPRLEFLRSQLQERLLPLYDERLILDYVSPVEADRAHMLDAAKAAPWAMTVDEWRSLQGQEPLPDNQGQVHMVPGTLKAKPFIGEIDPAPVPGFGGLLPVDSEAPPVEEEEDYDSNSDVEDDDLTASLRQDLSICRDAGDTEHVEILLRELSDDVKDLPSLTRKLARQEPRVRRMVSRHIKALSNSVSADDLAALLNEKGTTPGDVEKLIGLEDWLIELVSLMNRPWTRAWWAGANTAASELDLSIKRRSVKQEPEIAPPSSQVYDAPASDLDFNVVNPAAVEWAEVEGANFVTEFGKTTREALGNAVGKALTSGETVESLAARLLQLEIGLTPQQQQAVEDYDVRLGLRGIPLVERLERVEKFAESKRRLRAMTVARTELALSASNGQEVVWNEAIKQGALDPSRLRRKWLTTFDTRICAICAALGIHATVPFDKSFNVGGRSFQTAPAHPNCRCTVSLEVIDY